MAGVRAAMENLRAAGCQTVYVNGSFNGSLNGSFVTNKEVPGLAPKIGLKPILNNSRTKIAKPHAASRHR